MLNALVGFNAVSFKVTVYDKIVHTDFITVIVFKIPNCYLIINYFIITRSITGHPQCLSAFVTRT